MVSTNSKKMKQMVVCCSYNKSHYDSKGINISEMSYEEFEKLSDKAYMSVEIFDMDNFKQKGEKGWNSEEGDSVKIWFVTMAESYKYSVMTDCSVSYFMDLSDAINDYSLAVKQNCKMVKLTDQLKGEIISEFKRQNFRCKIFR